MGRSDKIEKLQDLLFEHLIKPDFDRIAATGALTPTRSLRHKNTRSKLSWATALEGRWFTLNMVKDAVRSLREAGKIVLPDSAGFCNETWMNDECSNLHHLLMRARKGSAGQKSDKTCKNPSSAGTSSVDAMDDAETQPWEADPAEEPSWHEYDLEIK